MFVNLNRIFKIFVWVFFAYSLLVYLCAKHSSEFAVLFDKSIGVRIRALISSLSSLFPFSLFEILIISSPAIIIFCLLLIFKTKSSKAAGKKFFSVISFISVFVSLYFLTLGVPSFSKDKAIDVLKIKTFSFEESKLYDGAIYLLSQLDNVKQDLNIQGSIESELQDSYEAVLKTRIKFNKPKKIFFSTLFSYTGALALYSYPTAEINLNTKIPRYMIPFTLAHEYAHFIGAASELDANFLAFVTCVESDNPSVKYSGYLSALEFLMLDIRKSNPKMYTDIYNLLPENSKKDISEYCAFSEKYHTSTVFRTFHRLNRWHLDAFDAHAASSYSDVTLYIVAYLDNLL